MTSGHSRGSVSLASTEQYREQIYAMLRAPGNAYRYRGVGPLTSRASIDQSIQNAPLAAAIVEAASREFVGFAQLGLLDLRHATAQMMGALLPERQGLGWPADGLRLFVLESFASFPLRKIYCEVNGDNQQVFGAGLERFFRYEATLTDHEWHRGHLTDVSFYSVSRSDLDKPVWRGAPGSNAHESASDLEVLLESLLGTSPALIPDEVDLIETGVVDSLGMLELAIALGDLADRDLPTEVVESLRTLREIRYWFDTFREQAGS